MGGKGEGDEEREGGWRKMRGREDGKGGGEEKERETMEEEGLREGKKEDETQRWKKRREENKHRTNKGGVRKRCSRGHPRVPHNTPVMARKVLKVDSAHARVI